MIIKNGTIVDSVGVRKRDFSIVDGKITYDLDKSGELLDASGKIIIPAFYNTHTHIAMVFLRNYGEGLILQDWLSKRIWPAEEKVDNKTLYYSALLGYVESMKSGVACVNDMYLKGLDEIIKASEKVGLRTILSYGMVDLNSSPEEQMDITKNFFSSNNISKNNLIKKAVSCHAPYTCSEELLSLGKSFANEKNVLFHIHISETRKEVFDILKEKKKRPIEYLDSLNILDESTILAHSSWVTKREIRIVGEKKVNVSHNPISNLKLATGGIFPFHEYEQEGANVTLGTDGPASNNNLDMVETLKITGLLQKHKYWDATKGNPKHILKAATENGAKALGFNAGLIEEGKLADFIIVDPKENMFPLQDYYTSIVYSMKRDNIEKLFVDGKLVYDKKPLNIKEEELIRAKERIEDFVSGLSD